MSEDHPENDVKASRHDGKMASDMGRMGDREADDAVTHTAVDMTQITIAMRRLHEGQAAKAVADRARAEVLAAVTVEKADVARVAAELEIPAKDAEVLLKEAGGDVGACFRKVIGLP